MACSRARRLRIVAIRLVGLFVGHFWDRAGTVDGAGRGSVFATLLLLGLVRLERNIRRERRRLSRERNMLLGVTHELKTPLANVQLGVDSLRRLTLSDADKEVVLETCSLAFRIWNVVSRTCWWQQDCSGNQPFNMNRFLGRIGWEACGRMGALGATRVQWEHDAKVDDQVRGDRGLWMLATTNLIDNALKYSDGEVWVKSTFDQHTASLEVQDAGPGISKDDREAALSPFVRLQENGSGTGLGLHLVSQTAKLHGARLDMNSLREGGLWSASNGLPKMEQNVPLRRENGTHHFGWLGARS